MAKTKTLLKAVGATLMVALVVTVTTVSLLGSSQESEALVAGGPGIIQFTSAEYLVGEADGELLVTLERVNGSEGTVSAVISFKDHAAINGKDYVGKDGEVISLDDGEKKGTFSVEIINNLQLEGNRDFAMTLTQGGKVVSAAIVVIIEDEPAEGTFRIVQGDKDFVVLEGGKIQIPVERLGGSEGAAVVKYSLKKKKDLATGLEFKGELFWKKGEGGIQYVTVATEDDGVAANLREITLTIKKLPKGAAIVEPSTATIYVADLKFPGELRFSEPAYSVNEEGEAVLITVDRLFSVAGTVISVDYLTTSGTAQAGEDFTTTKGKLEWLRGDDTSKTFKVPILDDKDVELLETFSISLFGAEGEILDSAEVNIVDNDVK